MSTNGISRSNSPHQSPTESELEAVLEDVEFEAMLEHYDKKFLRNVTPVREIDAEYEDELETEFMKVLQYAIEAEVHAAKCRKCSTNQESFEHLNAEQCYRFEEMDNLLMKLRRYGSKIVAGLLVRKAMVEDYVNKRKQSV